MTGPLADTPTIGVAPARLRGLAIALAVLASTVLAGGLALDGYKQDETLSAGTIRFDVEPGTARSFDIYVPLLDWGIRYPGGTFPARLQVDVRVIDRDGALALARGAQPDVAAVRDEGADATRRYIRNLSLLVLGSALVGGGLVAGALRIRGAPRLRVMLPAVATTALLMTAGVVLALPPRGTLDDPSYFARGPDIPAALQTLALVRESSGQLGEELDAQLVALGRLVSEPAERGRAGPTTRRAVVASDLHNNLLALPALERAAEGATVFMVGDVSSAGTPIEAELARRIAGVGDDVVYVTGNHDSTRVARSLADAGVTVLTEDGRLREDGTRGKTVVTVGGLRVAGYSDPFVRRTEEEYRQQEEPRPTDRQKAQFADWAASLVGRVDVILVHNPNLAELAVERLRENPPDAPLVILSGDTHEQAFSRTGTLIEINGGTVGAGGTGNFTEGEPLGLAVLGYDATPRFRPRSVDLVEIDVLSGSARAEREILRDDDDDDAG